MKNTLRETAIVPPRWAPLQQPAKNQKPQTIAVVRPQHKQSSETATTTNHNHSYPSKHASNTAESSFPEPVKRKQPGKPINAVKPTVKQQHSVKPSVLAEKPISPVKPTRTSSIFSKNSPAKDYDHDPKVNLKQPQNLWNIPSNDKPHISANLPASVQSKHKPKPVQKLDFNPVLPNRPVAQHQTQQQTTPNSVNSPVFNSFPPPKNLHPSKNFKPPLPSQNFPTKIAPGPNVRKYGILNPNDETMRKPARETTSSAAAASSSVSTSSKKQIPNSSPLDFHCNAQEYSQNIKSMQSKVLGVTSLADNRPKFKFKPVQGLPERGKQKEVDKNKFGKSSFSQIQSSSSQIQSNSSADELNTPRFSESNRNSENISKISENSKGSTHSVILGNSKTDVNKTDSNSSGNEFDERLQSRDDLNSSSDSMSKEDVQHHLLNFVSRNAPKTSPSHSPSNSKSRSPPNSGALSSLNRKSSTLPRGKSLDSPLDMQNNNNNNVSGQYDRSQNKQKREKSGSVANIDKGRSTDRNFDRNLERNSSRNLSQKQSNTSNTSSSSSENISDRLQAATVRTRPSQKQQTDTTSKKSGGVKNLVSAFNKGHSINDNHRHNHMNSVSSTGSSLRATSIASSTGNFGQNSGVNQNLNSAPTPNPGSLTLAPLLAQPHTTTFHSRSGSTPENQAHRVSNSLRNSNSPKNIKVSSLSQSSLLDTGNQGSDSVFHSPIPGTAIEFKTHQADSVVSQKSNFSQKSNTSLKSSCGSGSNTGNRISVGLEVVPEMGGKNSKYDQKLGFLSKNDSMSKIGSSSNNTTRSIENIANAPVHRRKLNTSGSMRRSNDGESSGVSSMMPRSASISNFRQENSKYPGKLEFSNSAGGVQTNTASMMSNKKSSASSSTNSLSNANRVSSMPKLSRTDSFPRRQPSNKVNFDGKINFDNMQPPDEHSRISGVITALPASSSYYNISASKARLLNNKNEKIDTKFDNKIGNKSSILDKNSIKSTSKIQENSASNTTSGTKFLAPNSQQNTPNSIDSAKPLRNSQVTNRPNTMFSSSSNKVQKQLSSTPASPTSSTSSTLNESLSATIKQSIQNANDLSTKAAQYESKSSEKMSLIKNIQRRIKEFNMYKQEIEEDMQENNELGEDIKRRIHECCTERDVEKFTLVVRDIEPAMGLIFSLTGRLKRCDTVLNALNEQPREPEIDAHNNANLPEIELVLQKRLQIEGQLEEAQMIKYKVEQRQTELAERLRELLSPEDFESYESFLRSKGQLGQQQVELDDRIILAEEQLAASKDSMSELD